MKYRKKPIIVDAFKWTGGPDQEGEPEWIVEALRKKPIELGVARIYDKAIGEKTFMEIRTATGIIRAYPGDYIICESDGRLHVCMPEAFEATYELVEEGT